MVARPADIRKTLDMLEGLSLVLHFGGIVLARGKDLERDSGIRELHEHVHKLIISGLLPERGVHYALDFVTLLASEKHRLLRHQTQGLFGDGQGRRCLFHLHESEMKKRVSKQMEKYDCI
jgi:hypothetical protein